MKQADRAFECIDSAENIVRHINAADGCPGVLATLAGKNYYLFDAHLDSRQGKTGELLAVFDDAVLVGTGDKSIWIGYLKEKAVEGQETFKLPVTDVLSTEILASLPRLTWSVADAGMCGSAGAGCVMVGLAADIVFARADIVLNQHYKSMGLYGSEYWTYSLSRAVG